MSKYENNRQAMYAYFRRMHSGELERRSEIRETPYISEYLRLWEERRIRTPLLFLIGGYAGVGKSTLAQKIMNRIPHSNLVPSGILRADVQARNSKDEVPELYKSTFDLHALLSPTLPEEQRADGVIELFKKQRDLVMGNFPTMATFAETEHQHLIFDGNHISPTCTSCTIGGGVIPIEVYLMVTDPDTHYRMISGPTHNRPDLTLEQWKTARTLHEFIVHEAEDAGKPVIEWNEAYPKTLHLVDSTLQQFLGQVHFPPTGE